MAIDYASNASWHEGERQMQSLLHVPERENPTSHGLAPYATWLLQRSPLLAIGTVDDDGLPWTTLLGGEPGFARYLGQSSIVGVATVADRRYDPVLSILTRPSHEGDTTQDESAGRIMSGLAIRLASRDRVKLAGRIVEGSFENNHSTSGEVDTVGQAQLIVKIEQSLGNCPKYLNKKDIFLAVPEPEMVSDALPLVQPAVTLLAKADLFFISSSYHQLSMGTNHRGGPPGFVRLLENDASGVTIVYPEYSGNRLYQTLGNLKTNPLAGLVFPDFDTGDVLYVTCTTEIVVGKAASALLPRSNLAIIAKISKARFVRQGLAFRGRPGEPSPYNPPVRYLKSERKQADAQAANDKAVYAKLLRKDILTPSIARLRFSVTDPEAAGRWNPGQYVALAFEEEMSAGYAHMRDDDPKSLNDDYVRTFTVSSALSQNLPHDEFEITMRNVGMVTNFLFRQQVRAGLEIPLKGFGGNFTISQPAEETVPFVAGGIGVTPLLAHLPQLDVARLKLLWTINIKDLGLVVDSFKRYPALLPSTTLFISGINADTDAQTNSDLIDLKHSQAALLTRRMVASDVQSEQRLSSTWYICTGKAFRRSLLRWLPTKNVVFEDFDY